MVDWACGEVAEKFYKSLITNDPEGGTWMANGGSHERCTRLSSS
jgi:hypothetical protein